MYLLLTNTFVHLILGLFLNKIIDTHYLTTSFISTSSLIILYLAFTKFNRFFISFMLAYITRLIIMFIDINKYMNILHSGDDTENFYKTGILISNNLELLQGEVYGGIYSKFIGFIFYIYGIDRVFVQYLNIIIFILIILLMRKIVLLLQIKNYKFFFYILFFFPHSLIFSSILLREGIISLLVLLSFYYYIVWCKYRKTKFAFISCLVLMIAALFHSGVIGLLFGYLIGFLIVNENDKGLKLSKDKITIIISMTIVLLLIFINQNILLDLPFLNKFQHNLETNETVYDITNRQLGGSAYLTSIVIASPVEIIMYSPLKLTYFIISPVPWEISSFSELFAFLLDGLFYLIFILIIIFNFKRVMKSPFLLSVIIGMFTTWLIFSMGVSNAGTAMRHRFKTFYIVIVVCMLIINKRREKE